MELDDLIEVVSSEFRKDPKNKVFASQDILIASVLEESGEVISPEKLTSIVRAYEAGSLEENDQEIYDAAVYCCSVLARKCFSDDPEDEDAEVDFSLSWIEGEDGSLIAEIRPD